MSARDRVHALLAALCTCPALLLAGCVTVEVPMSGGETRSTSLVAPTLDEVPDLPESADPPSEEERSVEDRLFALANEARAAEGLAELERHEGLAEVARRWSQYLAREELDLAHNPGFQDQIPTGWTRSGENVGWIDAGGRLSPEEVATRVHEGWMDSPGHRENILREAFTHLGVGAAHSPERGYYLTQNFATY